MAANNWRRMRAPNKENEGSPDNREVFIGVTTRHRSYYAMVTSPGGDGLHVALFEQTLRNFILVVRNPCAPPPHPHYGRAGPSNALIGQSFVGTCCAFMIAAIFATTSGCCAATLFDSVGSLFKS